MSKRKRIIIAASLLGLTLFGFHFYYVTKPEQNDAGMLQIGRIDFKQKIDSSEASYIRSYVNHLEGVKNTHFNIQSGILVFTYYLNGNVNAADIYKKVVALKNYKAERFVLDPALIENGCPINNPNSFWYKVYVYYQKVF